jgi:hypothetical protein
MFLFIVCLFHFFIINIESYRKGLKKMFGPSLFDAMDVPAYTYRSLMEIHLNWRPWIAAVNFWKIYQFLY